MTDELSALNVIFTEFYFWVSLPLMFLIHIGFMLYEVGVSRRKNVQHTLMKNFMLIPVITIAWFLFGWWIYFAFAQGPGITGGMISVPETLPWSEFMGVHFEDRITGVFWAAFLLFAWTAGSIISGSVIERIRTSAFLILAILIGAVFWNLTASWGWSPEGWMVQIMGYHDAYGSGIIHTITGFFALGAIVVLGPRIGKFDREGRPRVIRPHNVWMTCVGLFVIMAGFLGFYMACHTPILDIGSETEPFFTAVNIYGTPVTLSGTMLNFFLSLTGGVMVMFLISKQDPFWTFSGGLCGLIAASAGNDLYHPIQALIIGGLGSLVAFKAYQYMERKWKVDDVVGAVSVHGVAGAFGLVIAGFVLWGYPAGASLEAGLGWFQTPDGIAAINPIGQIVGAIIVGPIFGFLPAYLVAKLLDRFGLLRVPPEVELAGLDTYAYGDVFPYFLDRESPFETIEREEARRIVADYSGPNGPEAPEAIP